MRVAFVTTDNREHFKYYDAPWPMMPPPQAALLQGFSQIAGLEVHVISCTRKPMASPEKLADNVWFHLLHVPKVGWGRTAYQGCIRAIRRKLRTFQPDVVHGQGTEGECGLGAAFSGFPNLITIHGNMRVVRKALGAGWLSFYGLAALLESVALRKTDGILCLTNYTKAQVDEGGKRRTWVLPNAANQTFFDLVPTPLAIPHLFCIGSVDVRKNQNRLITALDDLNRRRPFTLTFAGRADKSAAYASEFLRLCSERPWCRYAGLLSVEEIQETLASATALVLPSLEDNCPMVILEAMAAGVPVAASKVGGIPDLIEHGVTGLLFDPESPTSIRDEVAAVLLHPDYARKMSENARTRAQERFAPRAVAKLHIEIYRELITS